MLRCSKEAFTQCTDHCKCGSIEDAVYVEGSECDRFNQYVLMTPPQQRPASERGQSTPVTNADCIRAMSVEELVSLLLYNSVCEEMDPYRDRCAVRNCRECLTEWLLRPTKEAKAWIESSCGSKA